MFANPKKFPCLSAYLKYCGYKGVCKETNRFNRKVKSAYTMVVDGIIKHRNHGKDKGETIDHIKTKKTLNSPLSFGQMYDEFKKNIVEKYPDYPKYRTNNMTINRIATFVSKEIYKRFH